MPAGEFTFEFEPNDHICDFGNLSACDSVFEFTSVASTLCLTLMMTPNGQGRYQGTAEFDFSGFIAGSATGPASGKAKGADDKRGSNPTDGASFKAQTDGDLTIEDVDFDAEIDVSCKGDLNNDCYYAALCSGKVKIRGFFEGRRVSESARFEGFFDAFVDGDDLSVTLDVDPIDDKRFGGSADDSLGFAYDVSGKYDPNSDTSKISLKGQKDGDSKGAQIKLQEVEFSKGAGTGQARYKVQGYKGSAEVATD